MLNKFKKILALPILACMLLTGCNNNNSNNSSSSSSSTNSGDKTNYYNSANFVQSDKEVNQTKLVTYDGPSIMTTSSKVGISVEDQELFVYETRVNHGRVFTYEYSQDTAPMAIFDFQGKVKVEIEVKDGTSVTSATISPLVYGIKPEIKDNKISFELEYPDNYTIEYNDDYKTAVHLFANPLEEDPITEEMAKNDPNIIYFGPGVYKPDGIPVKSGQTVYIAGGAVIYGQMIPTVLKNITIRGRGIISGAVYDRQTQNQLYIPMEIRDCSNVKLEGITILDPAGWTVAVKSSDHVTIDNIHIISARANSDGISVQSSSNVTVQNCFVRTWDDSLVVKNVDRESTHDILFDNNTVWTDLAQSMEVGYETYGPEMDNITFKNTTVVHNFHKPVISLHNCDDAHITNVHYENITVEDGQMLGDVQDDGENDFFIDFTIAYNSEWTKSEGKRGSVENVTIKNVNVYKMASIVASRMFGEGEDSAIKNVTISNVVIEGKKVNNDTDLKLSKGNYVTNVKYSNDAATTGAIKTLPYKIGTLASTVEKTNHQNISQDGVIVPEDYYIDGLSYLGSKQDPKNFVATALNGVGATNNSTPDPSRGDWTKEGSSPANVLDGDKNTTWVAKDWTDEKNDFVALNINMVNLTQVGVIRLYAKNGSNLYQTLNFSLFGRRNKTDGTPNDKFLKILSADTYSLSPGSGNAIDINFTANQYYELQIRFYKTEGITAPAQLEISEIEFYPPSLSWGKTIADHSEHNDVYPADKLVDGDTTGTSYYESKGLPAYVVIDLGKVEKIKLIVLNLPPMTSWPERTQNVQILVSNSNEAYDVNKTQFTEIVPATDMLFDPKTNGNMQVIKLDQSVECRYLKVVVSSNNAVGSYGAQLSEISVYGE